MQFLPSLPRLIFTKFNLAWAFISLLFARIAQATGFTAWSYGASRSLPTRRSSWEAVALGLATAVLFAFSTLPAAAQTAITGATQVATGTEHSCVLTSTGGVKCWGNNGWGQLGDNSATQRWTAVNVSGLANGVTAIATGAGHTCARTSGGGAKCWGWNNLGQLGDNSAIPRLTPVDVSHLTSGVTAIATGDGHTCALTSTGGAKCWGGNAQGQLGDNSTTQRWTEVDVTSLTAGVAAIATGGGHTCALLTSTGGAKCWGYNDKGQLGDSTTAQRLIAVDVSSLTAGVAAIDAGYSHTCALTSGGGVKATLKKPLFFGTRF